MKKLVINILKKYKIYFMIVWGFIAVNMYLLTYPPEIIGNIVDLLYDLEGNKESIIRQVIFLVLTAIALLLVRIPWRYYIGVISRGFEKDIKNKLFDQFIKMKMSHLQNTKNGELMAHFTKDIGELRVFLYRITSLGSRIIIIFILVTYKMMSGVNTKLTLATMCPIFVTAFLVVKIKKYVEKSFRKSQKYYTELSEYVQESTDSIRTTKAYCGEVSTLKEFIRKNKFLKQANNSVDVHSTLLSTCVNICFGLCYGISLIYGSKLVVDGLVTTGEFIAFNGYIGLFVGPVSWLPGIISRFKRAQISYHRLDEVFRLEREKITLPKNNKDEDTISGDIVIHDLTYNYKENIEVALNHINLEIKEGETLGIIGTIGSGKTTLMNLLLKLYPVENGKISIGGKDINDIPLSVLRRSICYITQDSFLFSSTLKDNISLFKDDYEDSEIFESTKKAMISDDIMKMNDGLYTTIGERGVDLSGGQKQRVVISRAFLQKSNIVIFDDTFCALDNKTEEKLLQNVKELTVGKTCIIISNRISDIKDADKIIVLDDGNMIDVGNHESLINRQGLYHKFYIQQSSKENEILD